jgi:hypothetical protein
MPKISILAPKEIIGFLETYSSPKLRKFRNVYLRDFKIYLALSSAIARRTQ